VVSNKQALQQPTRSVRRQQKGQKQTKKNVVLEKTLIAQGGFKCSFEWSAKMQLPI